jgi:hypothetical protein
MPYAPITIAKHSLALSNTQRRVDTAPKGCSTMPHFHGTVSGLMVPRHQLCLRGSRTLGQPRGIPAALGLCVKQGKQLILATRRFGTLGRAIHKLAYSSQACSH